MSSPADVAINNVVSLPANRKGVLDIRVDDKRAKATLGRRWTWSRSDLTVGVHGWKDWGSDWGVGAGLRFTF